jgi:DNA-directed RNA polymerase subunit K/omega
MSDIKTRVQGIDPNVKARNYDEIALPTGNIYESLKIIACRAEQLNNELKSELNEKLEEFASVSDAIEEVLENKEQIEISKFYERLPNPSLIATEEFLAEELEYRFPDEENLED